MDVARFVTALGPAAARLPDAAEVARLLAAATARIALPFAVDDDLLLAALGTKLATAEWTELAAALVELDVGEVALACACEAGDATALAHFETRYFPVIELALAPMKLPVGTVDEVRQLVRIKLFTGTADDPPKLRGYAGRGSLEGLVRVVAVRTALTLQRNQHHHVPLETTVADEILATSVAPELQLIKQRYAGEFKAAFERAIAELQPRDRMLLKMHLLERSTIDEIGALYHVHRATAARWLEAIRDRLGERTRELLGATLDLGSTELDSVIQVIQSQISLSMSRLLT